MTGPKIRPLTAKQKQLPLPRGRGRPVTLPAGSERVRVSIPVHVITIWRNAGGKDLCRDIATAFEQKVLQKRA